MNLYRVSPFIKYDNAMYYASTRPWQTRRQSWFHGTTRPTASSGPLGAATSEFQAEGLAMQGSMHYVLQQNLSVKACDEHNGNTIEDVVEPNRRIRVKG